MTDHELLEAAAKAAGYEVQPHPNRRLFSDLIYRLKGANWNPLTEDDDALRLAVSLNLLFNPETSRLHSEELASGKAPMEATRRAIVRAAAAMQPAQGETK